MQMTSKMAEIVNFVLYRVKKNIVEKRENASYHCSPFATMFVKALFLGIIKSWDCVIKGFIKFSNLVIRV